MKTNPLKQLGTLGQSIWLDYIKRDLITSGKLKKLIEEDGLRGMTSNPAIFEKAIAESDQYNDAIQAMSLQGRDANTIYETLTRQDIQGAADAFRSLYEKSDGKDGYVSLEVNPHLAHDTKGTIEEAQRLWKEVNRPNIFIKVPGTKAGLPAIQKLISEGINVNVTLLFGLPRYREVTEAYLSGMEARAAQGKPLHHVASVASFFLSRIDVLLDPVLERLSIEGDEKASLAKQLQGEVAIASAKVAYQMYKKMFTNTRFKKLAEQGAHVQRLLWASTGTKNPSYSDIKYVEPLIGPDTINTVPPETLESYRDHGHPQIRLEEDLDHATWVFTQLPILGINIDHITQQLEDEGVEKFSKPFDHLLKILEKSALQHVKKAQQ